MYGGDISFRLKEHAQQASVADGNCKKNKCAELQENGFLFADRRF
jgi:hypothetical protein